MKDIKKEAQYQQKK